MTPRRRPSHTKRAISLALVAGQVLILMPPAEAGTGSARAAAPASSAAPVKVNRTTPRGRAVPMVPSFSASPTEAEIRGAVSFAEPLLAVGGESTLAERRALASALVAHARDGKGEDVAPLLSFLAAHPESRYRASLLTNLGVLYREAGYFSRATESVSEAWRLSRGLDGAAAQAVALRALSELLELHLVFGHEAELEATLGEVDPETLHGAATERVALAREGLWTLKNHHENALPSGSTALAAIRSVLHPGAPPHPALEAFAATHDGASLVHLESLAGEAGLPLKMAARAAGADFPVPSVVHLKVGHFVAVTAREGDRYRIDDPSLDSLWGMRWLSAQALADESSGYALVTELPEGWRAAGAEEAARVRGKCIPYFYDVRATGRCNTKVKGKAGGSGGGGGGGGCSNEGMAGYNVHALLASLNITDTPLFYTPPRGPAVRLHLTYNQREYYQQQLSTSSHVGPKWTIDWLTSVVSTDPPWVSQPGGGREDYTLGVPHPLTGAILVQTSASPRRYDLRYPDGSVDVFGQPLGGPGSAVLMTESRDPQGQALTFTWDERRLVAVSDALGQVTTLGYGSSDPLRITSVTDPFGRSALLQYDPQGRLQGITDVIGLESHFTYAAGDVVSTMQTAYGTTKFSTGQALNDKALRWVEIVDPLGAREYMETRIRAGGGASSYWDKRAMAMDPMGLSGVRSWSFGWTPPYVRDKVMSEVRPLESPIVYQYPSGAWRPSSASRSLDDGSQQTYQWEYNAIGQVVKTVDPEGRETAFEYANNGIDLLRVKQRNGTAHDLLLSATWNTAHRPLTVTDAAGQTTTLTYTPRQQLETVTTPKNETWTLTYDPQGDYLQSISGPVGGATTGMSWDLFGRLRTVTNSDNYTITIDYDALNRPLQVSYPNGTHEDLVWEKLHVRKYRDLQGRWTEFFHDALARQTATRDSWGRFMALEWCDCGSLEKVVDWRGNATSWQRDILGRVIAEGQPDGATQRFVYETNTSRVRQITDAKGQTENYEYFRDDRLKRVSYGNTLVPTPPVALTYDSSYGRLATMTDGNGTTIYTYHPVSVPPGPGVGRLATIDGPLANDLVSYTYDELGRVLSRSLDGATTTVTYDALGRMATVAHALGTFSYGYDGVTGRLASVTSPGSFVRTFTYHDQSQDRMLREIHNRWGGATVSKFTYDYNSSNQITGWTQQAAGGPARRYEPQYVQAGQLGSVVLKDVASGSVLKSYAFSYDQALNRASEQAADSVTSSSHNALNQIVARQGGGDMRFAGFTSEASAVKVQGRPAAGGAGNSFAGMAQMTAGPNTVTLTATDPSNNTTTRAYDVTVTGQAATFTYDSNGNLTNDGTRTYTWDGSDRLVAIDQGTHRTEFQYDGFARRTRMVEKESGAITSNKRFLWAGTQMIAERDGTGATTLKRYFSEGVQVGGQPYLYARDHLGSIRELIDSSGAVRARYDYDPYGRRTKVSGDVDADLGFTGHYEHAPSGLTLAYYRAYDSNLGRWLSRDPLGLAGGLNRYAYAENDPINNVDRLGLSVGSFVSGFIVGAVASAVIGFVAAALGPVALAVAAVAGLAMLAHGLYQLATDKCLTEDEIHEMVGGMVGGLIGGMAGAKAGGRVNPKLPGNRTSNLPDSEPIDPNVHAPRVYTRAASDAANATLRGKSRTNLHDFPEEFDADILARGTKTVGDDYIQYDLDGVHNGIPGAYQIGVKPSTGQITHRFFCPSRR